MENVIEIKGLHKSFGALKVLKGLDLTIRQGEIVAIIGSSGCGKSVTLRCVEMLEKPDAGQIFVNGKEITKKNVDINKIRRSMGMVYQDFGLFSNMNVMENLCAAPMRLLKMRKADAEAKAVELLEMVGLADKSDSSVQALSGGEKQRVAICRAMMMDPKIMLFDEPTSALDPTMVGEVLATIRMLSRRGLTILIVTHEMAFARQIANRIVFLADGVVYEQGTPDEIFDHPQREKTVDFIRKLKHFDHHIDRRDFDFMKLQGGIQVFSLKYGLSANESYRLQICTEEMVYALLDAIGGESSIDVSVSFSETERTCELMFTYNGERFDPLERFRQKGEDSWYDNLGLFIISKKAKHYTHRYENGVNTVFMGL